MVQQETTDFLDGEVPVIGSRQPDGPAPRSEEFTAASSATAGTRIECDVLVVGAGFSGITAIHRIRELGLNVKCFESGGDFGGVWHWNRYPGARVDSEVPFYQLNIPDVYHTWNFSERFPDHRELRKYMAHVDQVLGLRKDTYFDARVIDAAWDKAKNRWVVKTQQGHEASAKYLILASGLLHRAYTPDFPGLSDYKGELYHSVAWKDEFSAKGKKVAIIGAGATAVQITQELGKQADELTVFLRRPSYCLPMRQRQLDEAEQTQMRAWLPALFKSGREGPTGFASRLVPQRLFDVPAEESGARFERLWKTGGFHFSLSNYFDITTNAKANRVAYDFWAQKVRERLTDPAKQKIMAPEEPPYYLGTKRGPLEQDYYEVLNQPNVRIHDLKAVPLKSFAERGMVTADDQLHEFDVVVLATGFDSFTGSVTQMGLKNKDGVDIKDLWKGGVHTYLGLTISGFPNLFMSYSPQAPTPVSNGTTIIEIQVETIADMIQKLEKEGASTIEARKASEEQWEKKMNDLISGYLMQYTDSWWNGANIPGKKKQVMSYLGGVGNYEAECRATLDGWKGFDVTTSA